MQWSVFVDGCPSLNSKEIGFEMNVMIELGSYDCRGIRKFMNSPMHAIGWTIHVFEPNPNLQVEPIEGVIMHKEAAWVINGEIDFYVGKQDNKNYSSSVIANKKTGKLDLKRPIRIPCVDFSQWIISNFKQDDYIVLKMDIEGAEYPILSKMLQDGSMNYIDELFVEPHWDRIGMKYEDHRQLIKKVAEITEVYYML